MTEKRYKLRDPIDKTIQCEEIEDTIDGWITYGDICDTLNEQHEEIIELSEAMKQVNQTKYTDNKDAIIKRIIKCYLTFEKEATANTILRHIDNTGYGLRGLKGSAYFTKQIKKWRHDDSSYFNVKWYVNDRGSTVFYLE